MKESQKLLESFKINLKEEDERLEYIQNLKDSKQYDRYTLNRLQALYDLDAPLDVLRLMEPFTKELNSAVPDYILKIYKKKPYLLDLTKYIINEKLNYRSILYQMLKYTKEQDIDFIKELINKYSPDTCYDILSEYYYYPNNYYSNKHSEEVKQLILNNIKGNESEEAIIELISSYFDKFAKHYANDDSISLEDQNAIYDSISNFLINLATEDTRIELSNKNNEVEFSANGNDWNWEEEKYQELADGTPKIWSTWYSKYKKFVNSELAKYNLSPVEVYNDTEIGAKIYTFSKNIGSIGISAEMSYVVSKDITLTISKS